MRRIFSLRDCILRSVEVSTRMFLPPVSISMEERDLLSRGSSDAQTVQLHPTMGIPVDVPLPRMVIFTQSSSCQTNSIFDRHRQGVCPGIISFLQRDGKRIIIRINRRPSMKVAMMTPYYYSAMRGNAVTVRRIEKYLIGKGCVVKSFSLENEFAEDISSAVREFAPDLIHA